MGDVTVSGRDLARWSETLAAIARTGMGFTESLYERERFEEVLHVAADIKASARELEETEQDELVVRRETDHFVQEWMESIGEGVPGYVTPKVAVGAIVGNDAGEILLVQRKDSGIWLYPTEGTKILIDSNNITAAAGLGACTPEQETETLVESIRDIRRRMKPWGINIPVFRHEILGEV